ncbi:MAG: Class A beta-lactamase, partial [uncultured Solirubrobacteraceae bacterium]
EASRHLHVGRTRGGAGLRGRGRRSPAGRDDDDDARGSGRAAPAGGRAAVSAAGAAVRRAARGLRSRHRQRTRDRLPRRRAVPVRVDVQGARRRCRAGQGGSR